MDAHDEAMDLDVAHPGEEIDHPMPRTTAEEEKEAEGEGAEQRASADVGARAKDAHHDPEKEEHRDDREAALTVEDLAGEEPAEDLLRAERVVEDRAFVVLRACCPLRVDDQRHEHPGGDEETATGREGCAADPADEAGLAQEDDPHTYGQNREVARDEVAGDREREGDGGSRVVFSA